MICGAPADADVPLRQFQVKLYTPVLDYELSVEEMYLYEPTYIPEGLYIGGAA